MGIPDKPGSPTPTDIRIGAAIRARREELGITQAQLAKGIGLTFQQIQKYEKGVNRVAASTLVRVADVLECHVSDLYGSPDDGAEPRSTSEKQIVRLWKQLRPREREAVIGMIREFIRE